MLAVCLSSGPRATCSQSNLTGVEQPLFRGLSADYPHVISGARQNIKTFDGVIHLLVPDLASRHCAWKDLMAFGHFSCHGHGCHNIHSGNYIQGPGTPSRIEEEDSMAALGLRKTQHRGKQRLLRLDCSELDFRPSCQWATCTTWMRIRKDAPTAPCIFWQKCIFRIEITSS
jgi:hypothetical protein